MNSFWKVFLFFIALIGAGAGASQEARAQDSALVNNEEPLEITADGILEWRRAEKKFIATQSVRAQQGDVSIDAERLLADYRESAESKIDIWQLTAQDNVVIRSKDSAAYGDKAVYDMDQAMAVMTGERLRMVSGAQVLTARDRFEYWTIEGRLVAIGRAKLDYLEDTLEADKITAFLKDNEKGERVLDRLEAIGSVVITTPTEILTGAKGVYLALTNKATLSGGVTIRRGANILEGARAEVDLNSNISRMHGGDAASGTGGRVRGVFYPDSAKKSSNDEPPLSSVEKRRAPQGLLTQP